MCLINYLLLIHSILYRDAIAAAPYNSHKKRRWAASSEYLCISTYLDLETLERETCHLVNV